MNKVAIVILAKNGSKESLGRLVNAFEFAKELKEFDDDVRIVFDGASVTFIPEIIKEDHYVHSLFSSVEDKIDGACKYCADAFGVLNEVEESDIKLLDDFDDHPSLRSYIQEGYQIVTF